MTATRRPRPRWTWGVVLSSLLLCSCGGEVQVSSPDLSGDDAQACDRFLDALPDTLAGHERREVSPTDASAAAYGDPALTVVCGGQMPPGYDEFSACDEVNDVGWYAPAEAMQDPRDGEFTEVSLGTITHSPTVVLTVPGEDRPEGLAAALAELATPIREHLSQTDRCH